MSPTPAYCFTNLGGVGYTPSMSCQTRTWPLVPPPAPMPIVGVRKFSVMYWPTSRGTISITMKDAPASSRARASFSNFSTASLVFPCIRNPPAAATACGHRPMCPTTTIPADASALIVGAISSPPSTLIASTLPSFMRRAALITASCGVRNEPNGISPTTRLFSGPVAVTALQWWIISSIVTPTVEERPNTTIPTLSPTRIISTPASLAIRALGASYAVSMTMGVPFSYFLRSVRTVAFFFPPRFGTDRFGFELEDEDEDEAVEDRVLVVTIDLSLAGWTAPAKLYGMDSSEEESRTVQKPEDVRRRVGE
mmetsp:Transcript_14714/g.41849  ORF Transcript_14714/g.41849 Transcript_14714/m.41849 type:complete len:310 (-) Transcript_14714:386-1315(-)